MPDRNELDYEFDDEETAYDLDDDDEAEGYDDDDEEYEDDEDGYDEDGDEDGEAPAGKSWKRTALFAIVGLLVAGAGGYYFMSDGNLPFLAKQAPAPGASPFANPGGFGKVAKAPEDPSQPAVVPGKPVAVATPEAPPQPVEPPQPVATAKPVAAKVPATPKPAVKKADPVAKKVAEKPAAKPATQQASRPAKAAALQGQRYAVQVGSFTEAANANNLLTALKAKGYSDAYLDNGGSVVGAYAVRSTVVNSTGKANELKTQFAAAGHPGSVVNLGSGKYALQLGIYSSRGSADNLARELNAQGMFVSVASGATKRVGATRVRVGNYPNLAAANQTAAKLRADGVPAISVKR